MPPEEEMMMDEGEALEEEPGMEEAEAVAAAAEEGEEGLEDIAAAEEGVPSESQITVSADVAPELADVVEGDQIILTVDRINEDGTIGLTVIDTITEEAGPVESVGGAAAPGLPGGAAPTGAGREAVLAALGG